MAIIKSPIFKDITESEISEMTTAGFLRARKFRKNSFIYHVTDIVHEIGIVVSGQVTIEYIDLWGNKAIMSNITPGNVFAETYALTGEPLMVDAVASETSVILFLDMNKLMNSQFENMHCNESRKAGSQEFVIPFDRQQLADYLNVDRSALSKELGKMRDEGLIEFRKNAFHLHSIC